MPGWDERVSRAPYRAAVREDERHEGQGSGAEAA